MLLGKFPVFSVVLPQFCCLTGVMKRKTDKDDYGLQTEFERIGREHKAAIYTVCYMFSDDNATVADMFQEVLINIRNGLENFQGRSSAGTWIWRVSLNTCISYEKKLRRRQDAFPLELGIDLYEENTDEKGLSYQCSNPPAVRSSRRLFP